MFRNIILLVVFSHVACKAAKHNAPSLGAPSTNPMSCRVTAKVVEIISERDADTGSLCAKYPCKAKVQLINVQACGSGVSQAHNVGDTVEMRFVYTLHKTAKLFPNMKSQYPGLKRGQTFTADAEQRIAPGMNGAFIVFGYEVE